MVEMIRILFLILATFVNYGYSMHCLVQRPGFGLVSEHCPSSTVACRIRVDHNAIEYYEYSPLYDRNQFVCVLRNEYGDIKQSGCVEKRTGKIRCWCYGRSNCNSAEDSKKLYEAFKSGNQERFHEVVEEIDFPNLHNDEDIESPTTTTTSRPSTTITKRPVVEKLGPRYDSFSNSRSPTSNVGVLKINNLPADDPHEMSKSRSKTHHHHHHKKHHSITTEKPTTAEYIVKEHIYKSPIIKVSKDRQQSSFVPVAANAPSGFSKPIVRPPPRQPDSTTTTSTTTTQAPSTTEEGSNVKVIYVNSKDKYQNVIGSPEFRKALHLDEPDEAHLLPTDNNKKNVNRNVDPFNTEYNENEEDNLDNEDDDPLGDLPMTDQEADLYLSDETRIPRVRARSKDLDEYASAGAYYDATLANSATKVLTASLLFACSTGILTL